MYDGGNHIEPQSTAARQDVGVFEGAQVDPCPGDDNAGPDQVLLAGAFHASPMPLLVIDAGLGIHYANDAAVHVLGFHELGGEGACAAPSGALSGVKP